MIRIKKTLSIAILLVWAVTMHAQNAEHVKEIVKELSSPKYKGRCYTNGGADKAANFIKKKMKKVGLSPLNNWYQPFEFELNQIHKAELKIDAKTIAPGTNYVIRRNSPSCQGVFNILHATPDIFQSEKGMEKFLTNDVKNSFVAVDYNDMMQNKKLYESTAPTLFKNADKFIFLQDAEIRDYVGYGNKKSDNVVISMRKQAFNPEAKKLDINLQTNFDRVTTKNVAGWFNKPEATDSVIIICGHYDHLGEMGTDAYFPGADDNASAIGAMIEMAGYLKRSNLEPKKNLLFVAFSGEEAGLKGALHFVNNLPIDKSRISYVINMDMIGFGNSELHIWNGEKESRLARMLISYNEEKKLVNALSVKENTPNSDHFAFTEEGIRAIFLTTGTEPSVHYHTVFDNYENTELSMMKEIMQLIIGALIPM